MRRKKTKPKAKLHQRLVPPRKLDLREQEALIYAIQIVGSVAEMASVCSCSVQAVYKWIHWGLPLGRVLEVAEATGGRVAVEDLYLGFAVAHRPRLTN